MFSYVSYSLLPFFLCRMNVELKYMLHGVISCVYMYIHVPCSSSSSSFFPFIPSSFLPLSIPPFLTDADNTAAQTQRRVLLVWFWGPGSLPRSGRAGSQEMVLLWKIQDDPPLKSGQPSRRDGICLLSPKACMYHILCLSLCLHVCMCVFMHSCVCMYVGMHVGLYLCTACRYVFMHVCAYRFVFSSRHWWWWQWRPPQGQVSCVTYCFTGSTASRN